MDWENWLILLTGPTAVYLTQVKNPKLHRYACIFGMVGQIGWVFTLYQHQQWGAFASCFAYTYAWYVGLNKYWLEKS